jgi:hypothetical protein
MKECANCHEDFVPPKGVEREFCSRHCENRHRGDECEAPCDYCEDDKDEGVDFDEECRQLRARGEHDDGHAPGCGGFCDHLASHTNACLAGEAEKQSVDVIASGYEWVCPEPCGHYNREIAFSVEVTCGKCGKTFEANPPNHAYA